MKLVIKYWTLWIYEEYDRNMLMDKLTECDQNSGNYVNNNFTRNHSTKGLYDKNFEIDIYSEDLSVVCI